MEIERYRNCSLCPRDCRVDRTGGQLGYCRESAELRVASVCVHFGEEPCFTGTGGSGTIFFAGCACRCFFCQNHQISLGGTGQTVLIDDLSRQCEELVERGVHNLNFVTPDHFWPHVKVVCRELRRSGCDVPFIYNCSGYMTPGLVDEVADTMDIFLPDFKFALPEIARTCMRDSHYPAIALEALRRMVEHRGFLEPFDPDGRDPARSGILVRHLVLPGQVENSLKVLEVLRAEFGRMLPLSVMSQFQPVPECKARNLFTDRVDPDAYQQVCDRIVELDFQQVFVQPMFDDTDFFPDFHRPDDPFPGNRRQRR